MAEIKKRQPLDVLQHWVRMIKAEGRGLTDWENSFVNDMQMQLIRYGRLTEPQEAALERIYADRTP